MYQTNPTQFSSLIYLGGKEDFEKSSKKKRRRRRKKRSTEGDALYLQYQPYSDGDNFEETFEASDYSKINPVMKIFLKPKSSKKFEQFVIPLTNVFKKIDGTPKKTEDGTEDLNIENYCQNALNDPDRSYISCLEEGWIFHVKLYQRFPDQLQVSLRWTIVNETMNTADFSDNSLSTHFNIPDVTAFLFQDQRPEIVTRERPASVKKKSKDQKDDDKVEHFWTIYDDKDFS